MTPFGGTKFGVGPTSGAIPGMQSGSGPRFAFSPIRTQGVGGGSGFIGSK